MTKIVVISRPRFWLYVFGPYIVGLAAGAVAPVDILRLEAIFFGLYFLLPANLLIYGVNDIFDYETDRLNPKKSGYESLVRPETYRSLWAWIIALNIPFLVAAAFLIPFALGSLAAFLLLSIFYSAPPVRAKVIPFLDSLFNVLYILPGAFAYQILTGAFPPVAVVAAASLWTAAMHAYSAIPDIEADRGAGVRTIATTLGPRLTHLFCLACYAVASALCLAFAPVLSMLGFVYVVIVLLSSFSRNVFRFYRAFPIVNAVSGFVLFWYVAWQKFF